MQKRILIVNPYGIGDLLFATPLFRNLKSYFPESYIAVAVSKNNVSVLENNPNVDKIIPFSRGDFKNLYKKSKWKGLKLVGNYIKTVYTGKFNLYFDLSMEYRYALIAKLLNIKPRLGYNYRNRGRFLTHKIDLDTGYEGKHVVEYHLGLLKYLGLEPKYNEMEFHLTQNERDWAEKYLASLGIDTGKHLVGIVPGGGRSWGKDADYLRWPYERFADVCKSVLVSPATDILLFGNTGDVRLCRSIIGMFRKEERKPIDVCGKTNLRQFVSLLEYCDLVVCNATGPLHMATALDKRVVCFYGPVSENIYGPYPPSPKRIVLSKDLPCRPCYKNFKVPECRNQHKCLKDITVEEVEKVIRNLINKGK